MHFSTPQFLALLFVDHHWSNNKNRYIYHPPNDATSLQSFNTHRNASSSTTPLQVGNGNFAFGADVTGLQTFSHFAIQSITAWHNFSLPSTPGQTASDDFTGLDWWTHGRLVNYDMPNPAENNISNWLIQNPQRLSMANIGLYFGGDSITEVNLLDKSQDLDLWEGTITSSFQYNGSNVSVQVWCHPSDPVLGIEIKSELLCLFNAPYVGVWDTKATSNNTVDVQSTSSNTASFGHTIDDNIARLDAEWSTKKGSISGPLAGTNKFVVTPTGSNTLQLVVSFAANDTTSMKNLPSYDAIASLSKVWWYDYWTSGAFIDLSATENVNATEFQRRIVLSQYLVAVNEASDNPPQESGLVNNGWYGKFHGHYDRLRRNAPGTYQRFLQSSIDRATAQGYAGARWGKMTDPTGRSSPGEINALLIWQQPHVMHFAEYFYRAFPHQDTLQE